jgi:hypothetical protein
MYVAVSPTGALSFRYDYGHLQGLLMLPARVAQALSPWLFGLLLARDGRHAMSASAALGLAALGALMLVPGPQQRRETSVKPHVVNR